MFGFSKKTQEQQKPQQPQQEQQPSQNEQQAQQPEPQGLDKFASLVQNNNVDTKDGEKPQPLDIQAVFKDPEFIAKAQAGLRNNLQNAISDQTKQLMENNDPAAMQSMMMDMASAVYMQSLEHSASLQDLTLKEKLDAFSSTTDQVVDSKLQQSDLQQAIPQMQNPILRLGIEGVINQIQAQNPTMTPQEVNGQVQEYFGLLNQELNPDTEAQAKAEEEQAAEVDWINYATNSPET